MSQYSSHNSGEKLDVVDLIISTLTEHEKTLDRLIEELEHLLRRLTEIAETCEKCQRAPK